MAFKPKQDEMKKQIRYSFTAIDDCNMCGSPTRTHKILGKRLNQSQGKSPRKKTGVSTTVARCSNCGLIYSNPQPIPFDIQDHYGIPPEDYWQESYFRIDEKHFLGEIAILKRLLNVEDGMKSLDIGAGLGKTMIALKNTGFDAYGFEPSIPFYERAISKMGVSPDKLKQGMIEEVDYPNDSFDFITFGAVLEHLYDPAGSILKALGWLKSGGIIHIEVPSSDWLVAKLVNLFYRLSGVDYVSNTSPMHEPFHLYEFALKSFQEHSKRHGYDIAFHQYYVCRTYMPKIADFFLKPYMKWTNQGMELCVWLRKK